MRSVILFIELLRAKPVAMFWGAVLAQAALWWLIPTLFYAAPPEALAEVLAVGHEFRLGSAFGPPLAYWVAEVVYRVAGLAGVYLAAQICVVAAYWAVFTLGRAIVGDRQAALAMLLMIGVFAFAMPTADFGPGVLAMPLWALALLHYWRAVGEARRLYWLALGLDLGLLLLTPYAGFVLLALLSAFTLATRRGRAQLLAVEPWIGGVIVVLVVFPHLIWFDQAGGAVLAPFAAMEFNLSGWIALVVTLVAGHTGLLVLLAIGVGQPASGSAPEIIRAPIDPVARGFIVTFALAPVLASAALMLSASGPHAYVAAPLVLLSALAAVTLAPDRIRIVHQRLAVVAWTALLLLPPLTVAGGIALLPWLYPAEFKVAQPAKDIGQFFAANFQRRAGRPLTVVAGDTRLAALIALAAPSRPSLLLDATPELTPWVTPQQVATRGALVVWIAGDTRLPPPAIRARFPDLVAEPPQAFARRFEGRLPPIRIGWAVIAPRAVAEAPR